MQTFESLILTSVVWQLPIMHCTCFIIDMKNFIYRFIIVLPARAERNKTTSLMKIIYARYEILDQILPSASEFPWLGKLSDRWAKLEAFCLVLDLLSHYLASLSKSVVALLRGSFSTVIWLLHKIRKCESFYCIDRISFMKTQLNHVAISMSLSNCFITCFYVGRSTFPCKWNAG